MLPDLKAWEANRPEGAPKLLVVSAGTEEANQAMSLDSPVVLDQNFGVGREFGASGTPSAVLVDAEGNIASEVAVGAPKVLDLAKAGSGPTNTQGSGAEPHRKRRRWGSSPVVQKGLKQYYRAGISLDTSG